MYIFIDMGAVNIQRALGVTVYPVCEYLTHKANLLAMNIV